MKKMSVFMLVAGLLVAGNCSAADTSWVMVGNEDLQAPIMVDKHGSPVGSGAAGESAREVTTVTELVALLRGPQGDKFVEYAAKELMPYETEEFMHSALPDAGQGKLAEILERHLAQSPQAFNPLAASQAWPPVGDEDEGDEDEGDEDVTAASIDTEEAEAETAAQAAVDAAFLAAVNREVAADNAETVKLLLDENQGPSVNALLQALGKGLVDEQAVRFITSRLQELGQHGPTGRSIKPARSR